MLKSAQSEMNDGGDARISIRTKADVRHMLSRAADLSGLDLTSFVVSAALRQAKDVIREHEVILITSEEDRATFRAALEAPGRHIPALAELLKTPSVLNVIKR